MLYMGEKTITLHEISFSLYSSLLHLDKSRGTKNKREGIKIEEKKRTKANRDYEERNS